MKKAGRLFLLKVWLDGAYTTIAAQRTASMNLGNEQIDVTSKDGSRWRELLEGGMRNVSISSSGLVNDSESHALMLQYAHEGTIGDYQLLFADDLALELTMQVSQFESAGDYKDAQQYSITFESANDAELVLPSAGTIQWTVSASDVSAGGNATLTASRVGGSDGAASVNYATSNGTATAGTDYTDTSGTFNWAEGDATNKTANVPIAARVRQLVIGSRGQFSTTNLRIYTGSLAFQQGIANDESRTDCLAVKADNSQLVMFKSGTPRAKVYNPANWAAMADPSNPPTGPAVRAARYTVDGSRLAAVGNSGVFGASTNWRIYDSSVLPYVAVATPALLDANAAAVAWSPTQPRLLIGTNNSCYLINATADAYATIQNITSGTNANVSSADYSPDGSKAAVGFISISGGTPAARVYNTADWTFVSLPAVAPYTTTYGVRFSNDGAHLAVSVTSGAASALLIYRVSDWTLLQTLAIATAIDPPAIPAWRGDDGYIAVGVNLTPYVRVFDTSTDPYTPVTFAPSTIPPGNGCVVEWSNDVRDLTLSATLSNPTGGATLGTPIVQTVTIGP